MKRALTFSLVMAAAGAPARAGDDAWPQWLGPTRDGRAAEAAARKAPRLALAWKKPLGGGSSGLVVAGGRVFTLFSDEESEFAVALAVADGREIWRAKLDAMVPGADGGPVSTPLVAGSTLVTLSSACQLRALDTATGRVAWQRDMKADFAVKLGRGCATSPLLEGGRVIVQAGGRDNDQRVVALDAATGATVWTSRGTERTTYTSPVVAEIGGVRQLVVHHTIIGPPAKSGLMGIRLADQSVLWSRPLETLSFDTPLVLASGAVVLGSWSDTSAVQVTSRAGRFEAKPGWATADLSAVVSPPVFRDGHLYGFSGDFLACVDSTSGRTVWKEKIYGGSVILIGDQLAALSITSGLLRLVQASPAGYRELARLEVLNRGSRADTPPSFAAGHVFVRNDEELAAVRVEG
jgi:outer membrane protein assembly factor BamB